MSPVLSLSPDCAHLVVSRHGPAPFQKHVLNTTNGCPGCLCVPEQCSGAGGCPVKGGARYSCRESLAPGVESGLDGFHWPLGLPPSAPSTNPREIAAHPGSWLGSYPPNLSMMAFRFCARGPRGRLGADTLRSGARSFFFSEGWGSVGLSGTSLGEDSLHEEVAEAGKVIEPTPQAAWRLGRGHCHRQVCTCMLNQSTHSSCS